ncbi:MAG: hypothetical protein ABIL14_01425 [candidate division WOR-3 bacterium]
MEPTDPDTKADTNEEEIVEYIVGNWESWKYARKAKEQIWQDCLNNYLTIVDESKYTNWPWRCKVSDTFSQEIGDIAASALKNALFPFDEEFYRLEPLDDIAQVYQDKMKKYLDSKLKESRFIERYRPFLKQLAVIGNSAAFLPWKTITRPKKIRTRSGVQTYDDVVYDLFRFDTLDMLNVVLNPDSIYSEDSPIIIRSLHSLASLKSMKEYKNLDKLEASIIESKHPAPTESDDMFVQQRKQVFGLDGNVDGEEVELLSCRGDMEINGKVYRDYVGVVANRKFLIQFKENPFWGGRPVVFSGYSSMWYTPYGIGPLEPVKGIHELINTFTCQKADILNLIIMGSFAYVNDGIIDPDNLFNRPAGAIEVGDINNIKPLAPNANVALAYQEIAQLRDRGERSSGVTDIEAGVFPGGRKTAYEAGLLKQGSFGRFSEVIKHIGETSVEYPLNFFLTSLKQFKYGSGEIEDEALLGKYKIEYFGASLSEARNNDLSKLAQLADMASKMGQLQVAIDPVEFMQEWRRVLGIKNSRILRSPEQVEAELNRQKQLEAAKVLGK